jgi:hypothetical protein
MILGNPDPQLTIQTYTKSEQAVSLLNSYLEKMSGLGVA